MKERLHQYDLGPKRGVLFIETFQKYDKLIIVTISSDKGEKMIRTLDIIGVA